MSVSESSIERNQALDITKGVLVLFMILYHWFNYFVGIGGAMYVYLRFIPPSFIFIAGFLLGNVYPEKYGFRSSRLYARLIIRGLKLLVLFIILNVLANVFFTRSYRGAMPGVDGFIRDATVIFVSGNAKAAFNVLVPISYLLFAAGVIMLAGQVYKQAVAAISVALFLCIAVVNSYGLDGLNLSFVGIGLLGVFIGTYPSKKIDHWVSHPNVVVCLNVGYVLVISIWEPSYLLQAVGVCLSVTLIYTVGLKSAAWWGEVRKVMVLLGQYSLFGYVAQIGLLQLLQSGLTSLNLDKWELWVMSFVGGFVLTIMVVKTMHYFRAKSDGVDRLYKFAFS